MVKGLDLFRDHFREFQGSFVLIGGAACDQWFTDQGLSFRATKDLDIVLLIEVLDHAFIPAFRAFVESGGYEIRERSDSSPILYRFAKPKNPAYPAILELFSRSPDFLELSDGQTIIPVQLRDGHHSLSAILLDGDYETIIRLHHAERDGIRFATVTALIPLKAKAWLDLTERRERGEKVDAKDIDKHRNDVFRLAATLPGEAGPELPRNVRDDLAAFLTAFPETGPDWAKILDALKATFGGNLQPQDLLAAIRTFFRIP